MGVLIEGKWRDEELPQETGRIGEFKRADSIFRDRITADGSSGYKAEAGLRYRARATAIGGLHLPHCVRGGP